MSIQGHPTKPESKQLDTDIHFYWARNIGIAECMDRSGHSFRSIRSRYDKWDKRMEKQRETKFLVQQERGKDRALHALDKQLVELISVQQEVITTIANIKKPTPDQQQHDLRTKLAWMIFDLTDRRASLDLTPAVAAKVKQEVKELIEKYQKQPLAEPELKRSQ